MLFCTVLQNNGYRQWWTLPLDLLVDLASMITLRRFYVTRFTGCRSSNGLSSKLQCLPSTVSEVPALRTAVAFAPHSLKLVEEWGFVLRTAGTYACHLRGNLANWVAASRTWKELFTATSPFANHQPTTVPVWAQYSSLQTHLHMTFTSENYWRVNLLTYLLTIIDQQQSIAVYSSVF